MMFVRLSSVVLLAVLCCSIASCGAKGAGEGKAISDGGSDVEGKSKMDCSITILYDNTVAQSGVWRPETEDRRKMYKFTSLDYNKTELHVILHFKMDI